MKHGLLRYAAYAGIFAAGLACGLWLSAAAAGAQAKDKTAIPETAREQFLEGGNRQLSELQQIRAAIERIDANVYAIGTAVQKLEEKASR